MAKRPRSTTSDADYRRRLEDHLNWRIFAGISLGAASGIWRYVELGRDISRDELPQIRAGTWPRNRSPISGSLIRWSIPFMFLAGLGIECLLKAIRILQYQADGKPVAEQRKGSVALARELKTRNLLRLAGAAGIDLSSAETALLERLTDFVEWAGRYPVGVAADRTSSEAGAYYATDRDAVFAFVERLTAACDRLDPNKELYKQFEQDLYGDDPPK